MSVLTLWSRII